MSNACEECGGELEVIDYYGPYIKKHYWQEAYIEKVGDIYQCQNEECQEYYHNDTDGNLHYGYPC